MVKLGDDEESEMHGIWNFNILLTLLLTGTFLLTLLLTGTFLLTLVLTLFAYS
jgi:hypothetical protein